MIPLILGSIIGGRVTTIIFLTLVSGFGFKEFAKATGLDHDWWITGACDAFITATGIRGAVRVHIGTPQRFGRLPPGKESSLRISELRHAVIHLSLSSKGES